MKLLFLHQNCPGQFRHLIGALARMPENEVVFITQKNRPDFEGVRKIEYEPHRGVSKSIHPYLIQTEAAVINAQSVARAAVSLRDQGFVPDVVLGNPGWGETLFIKDVFPRARLISYCEFFYRGQGSDVGFDPEFPSTLDTVCRARTRAGPHLLALEASDYRYSPTEWQKAQFPAEYRASIEVIHDGIDCTFLHPDPAARLSLESGISFGAGDEIVTYVARNLEPYRGFHSFMRALPRLLELRPEARVMIVGGDGVSYGSRPRDGSSWRDTMLAETGLKPDRVHFLGRVPYPQFVRLLQVSAAHIYLTYPFVLSWSMLEAMALGCHVIGSKTAPVEEVIVDGENGHLVDFFDPGALAETTARVLAARGDDQALRAAARATVQEKYDLKTCLNRQLDLIRTAAAGR